MLLRIAAVLLAVLSLSTGAFAGGLYIQEFGTPEMGAANAGGSAIAESPSTMIFNPAGLTRVEGTQLLLGGGFGFSFVEFDSDDNTPASGGDGGNAGGFAPLGGSFFSTPITERLVFGAGVYSFSAAVLDYDDDWAGRYEATDVSIFTVTGGVALGYRIHEGLSVGAAGGMLYGKLEMELFAPPPTGKARAKLDGDDVVGFWNVGILLELSEKTRIGAAWWSESELEFGGDLDVDRRDVSVDVNTKITFPMFIRVGLYHELCDDWVLLASVDWEDWSKLDEVIISGEGKEGALARNWEDTWHFALGFRHRLCDEWVIMAGAAYDTSPVESSDRTADMPIDRQIRINCGATYRYSETTTFGASLGYLDLGDAAISSNLLKGEYSSNSAVFLGLNVNFRF